MRSTWFLWLGSMILLPLSAFTATFTSNASGNWSAGSTWVGGVAPSSPTDDVIIRNGHTITVNVTTTIRHITIGTTNNTTTLQITSAGIALTINGNLVFNQNNNGSTYRMYTGPGTINVNGTVSWSATAGTHEIRVTNAAGVLNVANNLTIGNNRMTIYTTIAGATINFYGNLTEGNTRINAITASNVNFYGDYIVNSVTDWTNNNLQTRRCNVVFKGTGKFITANANLTFPFLIIDNNASVSLSNTGTTVFVMRFMTLNPGSTFIMLMDFEVRRGWTNNGGTLVGNGHNFYFTCSSNTIRTIGGSASTTFPHLHFGRPGQGNATNISLSANFSCLSLTFENNNVSSTVTSTGPFSVDVAGDLELKQRGANVPVIWNINTGSVTVGGDLIFTGTTNNNARLARLTVTSGSLDVAGTISWMNQTGTAFVTTEVIQVGSGRVSFGQSVAMPRGSGTINVTGSGKVFFNGNTPPSLNFNANGNGTNNAVFTTTTGCFVYFERGVTNSNAAWVFANGSTEVFTGTSTISPNAAITFGNVIISESETTTLAGNISVTNNWIDSGAFVPGTNTVTFNGTSGTTQTVGRTTGQETFYGLSATTTGATIALINDVLVTNALAMSGHNFNLAGSTLTVGNNAVATLTRTGGIAYDGTFRRWWPSATAISPTAAPLYGLFPVGVATQYRPVAITSTVNPTSAGYVSVTHDPNTGVIDVTYLDNEASIIQRISEQKAIVSTSGVAGGTYTVAVTFGGFAVLGTSSLAHYKQITYTSSTIGSVGTTIATSGTIASPTVTRAGVSLANLNKDFVCGTTNSANTPIRQFFYSRKPSGTWNDNNATTGTWSYYPGGAGIPCACIPTAQGYAVVSANQTVTVTAAASVDYVRVSTGGVLTGGSVLTVGNELVTQGSGVITPTAAWTIGGDLILSGNGASTTSATLTTVNLNVGSGTSLSSLSGAAIVVSGDAVLNGNLNVGLGTTSMTGVDASLSGLGVVTGTGTFAFTGGDKSILSGSNLTIAPNVTIASGIDISNFGFVTATGNINGAAATSSWTNQNNSRLIIAGSLMNTGILNASAPGNLVEYNAAGTQTIKVPSAAGYAILRVSNSGNKAPAGNMIVNEELHIANSVILNSGTFVISGSGNLRMNGTAVSEYILSRGVAGTYPELDGTYLLTAGTVTLNQTAGTCTVTGATYYNLKFTGSQTREMENVSNITNNFDLQGSCVWVNGEGNALTVGGTTTYSSTGNTTLDGDLTTGAFSQTTGTFNDGSNVITITGIGWYRTGGTFNALGTTSFTGSSAQYVGGSLSSTFATLRMNHSGSGLTLDVQVNVSDGLQLINGDIHTTSTNLLTLLNGSATGLGNANSYVVGPMAYVLGSASTEVLTFPIGKGADWRPIDLEVTHTSAAAATYTAEIFNVSPAGFGWTLPSTVSSISTKRYYSITRGGASNLDSANLTVYYSTTNSDDDGVTDFAKLTVVKAPSAGTAWTDLGGAASANGTGHVRSGAFTTFSLFALGNEVGGANPLPIDLLYFDAFRSGEEVMLNWATASEYNTDLYVIERSSDGSAFEPIASTKANGFSNRRIEYTLPDEQPMTGWSYYRLRSIDYDGQFELSEVRPIWIESISSWTGGLYPNPARRDEQVYISDPILEEASSATIQLFDARGSLVRMQSEIPNGSRVNITPMTQGLMPGHYVVVLWVGERVVSYRMVVD